jgi:ubiquinone/menaquinone biosynthesis C-methylase UbiE
MADDADELLEQQVAYYRARAGEYDETSVGDVEVASRWFGELVEELAPRGELLEIACGTGLWTQHLVPRAVSVTALDSSPEMIELARARLGDPGPQLICADVFAWEPERRYDCVFFGFWLSHVPPGRFAAFWRLLERWLVPGGRALFVDEGAPRVSNETLKRDSSAPLAVRRLHDGTTYEIVKVFYEPDELMRKLADLGWSAELRLSDRGFLIGTARRR